MTGQTSKDPNRCMLCCNKIANLRNSVHIFKNNPVTSTKKPLCKAISSILHKEVQKDGTHSQLLCKKCFKHVDEADKLEETLSKVKSQILSSFNAGAENSENEEGDNEECNNIKSDEDDHFADFVDNTVVESESGEIEGAVASILQDETKVEEKMEVDQIFEEGDEENKNNISAQPVIEVSMQEVKTEMLSQFEAFEKGIDNDDIPLGDLILEVKTSKKKKLKKSQNKKKDGKKTINKKRKTENEVKIEPKKEPQKPKEVKDVKDIVSRNEDVYTCLLCDGEEKIKGDCKVIVYHLKEKHDTRLYICDMCGDMFNKRPLLSQHLDDHAEQETGDFQCETCNRIFPNLRLFRIHKRVHNPQVKSWGCDVCGKRYGSKNLLDEHMNTHTGNRPYVCEVCGKSFASKYTYRAHARTHEVRPRPFSCDKCSKSFLSLQNLTQHLKTHNGLKEYICHECGKAFGTAHNLEVHNIVHTGNKPYICSFQGCGKAFARKAEIRDHERTHTGEKPYQCEFCGSTFSQRSNLQSHKRATHYNDKRYRCDECDRGFKRRRLLDYHIKAVHTGERPFKCKTCDATFVYPEHYKKHLRIHTGEKPYLCEVCGKAFNSRDNRNAHRFIHSDKKPYECLVCGMGYMRKPLLYAHMQQQGHLNDTIVVNQPRLTTEDDDDEEEGGTVKVLVQTDNGEEVEESAQLIVTNVGDFDEDGSNDEVVDNSDFEEIEIEEAKFRPDGEPEDEWGEGDTIIIPAGTDMKKIIGKAKNGVKFVQISLPQSK